MGSAFRLPGSPLEAAASGTTAPDPGVAKAEARRSFSRAASTYDLGAALQREVCHRLLGRVPTPLPAAGSIVDVGCGTGYALPLLGARFPARALIAVDFAFPMLERASARLLSASRTKVAKLAVCGDAEALPLRSGEAALVWSSLTYQWCRLAIALTEAYRVLVPGGLIVFSTMGPDTLHELREAFADAGSYTRFNRFTDSGEVEAALRAAGFALHRIEREPLIWCYPSIRAVVQDLKAIGAHNVTHDRPRGLSGHRPWTQASARYERRRRNGMLPATYDVIYAVAGRA